MSALDTKLAISNVGKSAEHKRQCEPLAGFD
jgi:hypothetical protein